MSTWCSPVLSSFGRSLGRGVGRWSETCRPTGTSSGGGDSRRSSRHATVNHAARSRTTNSDGQPIHFTTVVDNWGSRPDHVDTKDAGSRRRQTFRSSGCSLDDQYAVHPLFRSTPMARGHGMAAQDSTVSESAAKSPSDDESVASLSSSSSETHAPPQATPPPPPPLLNSGHSSGRETTIPEKGQTAVVGGGTTGSGSGTGVPMTTTTSCGV